MHVADFEQGKTRKKFDGFDNWLISSVISFIPIIIFSLLKALFVNKNVYDIWSLIISDFEIYFIYVTMVASSMLNLFAINDGRKWRKIVFVFQLLIIITCGLIYGIAKWNEYSVGKLAIISICVCILIIILGIFSFYEKKR